MAEAAVFLGGLDYIPGPAGQVTPMGDGAWRPAGFPPRSGRAGYAHGGRCVEAGRYPRVPGLALHVHSYPLPGPAGQLCGRGGACGPTGILGCPVSPCMSTSAPALRYPWLLAGDVVEVWVWLQCSNDAARDAMVLYLQCRGPSVHRQRSKVTLGCLPGPTHLRIKWRNSPCRASATPEPKGGRYDVRWPKCP